MGNLLGTEMVIGTAQIPAKPGFLRLPKSGNLCPWTGLSRSKMNELILPNEHNDFKPPVRSICLRNRGQKKGVRLIVFDSLMDYLRSFSDDQSKSKGGTPPQPSGGGEPKANATK
jgi:hypothetical protein